MTYALPVVGEKASKETHEIAVNNALKAQEISLLAAMGGGAGVEEAVAEFTALVVTAQDARDTILAQNRYVYQTFADLAATITYTTGQTGSVVVGDRLFVIDGGLAYRVAASGASDHHITAGGVRLYVISNPATPQCYGAAGSAATDAPAFQALFANHKSIYLPWRLAEYNLGAVELTILDDQHIVSNGATIIHSNHSKIMFHANDSNDWSWTGKTTLVGLLTASADTGECGLKITNGDRYRVEGVTAKLFKGRGFHLTGTNQVAGRGDRGVFSDCAAYLCFVGRQLDAGAGAEYTSWSNWNASGNITGDLIGAGNTTNSGGSVVDNETGVKLVAGSNHGHGIYHGTQISHNTNFNIEAVGVLNGYTFSGCHIYGSPGAVWLNGCRGVHIRSGILDCPVFNDNGSGSGANYITDNNMPTGGAGITLNSNNGGLTDLHFLRNYDQNGPHPLNDPGPVYVQATRAVTTQNVAAGATAMLFNNAVRDRRAAYNTSTGIFTAPVDGVYRVSAHGIITANSGLVNGFIAINKNAVTTGYVSVVAISGTVGVISGGYVDVIATAGDDIGAKITITGTNPLLAVGATMSIGILE
jgi:hypothetical protein